MADSDPTTFSFSAAKRIAKAVRIVEIGQRGGGGIEWTTQNDAQAARPVRFCTWTGTWDIATSHAIRFATPTSVTATAYNTFMGVPDGGGWVARDGTHGWSLVSVRLTDLNGYSGNEIQLLGHDALGVATWYSITTCATAS